MNQNGSTFPNATLMTLLGGATLGGFAVAFTGTKTGKELLSSLKALAGRLKPKAGRPDPTDNEIVRAAFI
jgi:outer membrane lipoprotein SlyB